MSVGQTLLAGFLVVNSLLVVLWLVSVWRKDASIIDPFWGFGFVVIAILAAELNDSREPRHHLLLILTAIWGLRLSLFLLWRNWGHPEDRRYTAMRDAHGQKFWWVSLFTVFLLQGAILWFVALPLQMALATSPQPAWGALDALGLGLWSLGFFFEAVGDWQMQHFRANPANQGQVMDRGLWRYTRHPNYFGDFCVWWGLYLISATAGAWWTVLSPMLMSVLLLKVSGVTLLEKTIRDRRPAYADYQARTSSFFPWPPKKRVSSS